MTSSDLARREPRSARALGLQAVHLIGIVLASPRSSSRRSGPVLPRASPRSAPQRTGDLPPSRRGGQRASESCRSLEGGSRTISACSPLHSRAPRSRLTGGRDMPSRGCSVSSPTLKSTARTSCARLTSPQTPAFGNFDRSERPARVPGRPTKKPRGEPTIGGPSLFWFFGHTLCCDLLHSRHRSEVEASAPRIALLVPAHPGSSSVNAPHRGGSGSSTSAPRSTTSADSNSRSALLARGHLRGPSLTASVLARATSGSAPTLPRPTRPARAPGSPAARGHSQSGLVGPLTRAARSKILTSRLAW